MGIFEKLRRLTSNTGPRECGYGKTPGAFENCAAEVPPGQWFCSEEHAALDQSEQFM